MVDTFQKRLWLMRHRITAWADAVALYREAHSTRMVMVLLTYAKVEDYKPGHINYYLKLLKQSLREHLLAFAWVAELQERGAVHYHLVLLVDKGTKIPLPDKSGMWSHGLSGIHTARTPFYLLKYTGKERQKDLGRYPKSCRLYAASVRGLGEHLGLVFRHNADLPRLGNAEGERVRSGEFQYLGSSVTADYMTDVVLASAMR